MNRPSVESQRRCLECWRCAVSGECIGASRRRIRQTIRRQVRRLPRRRRRRNHRVGKALKVKDFHDPDVQKQSDADLTAIIAKGKDKMPEYDKTLKPEEIKGLVAYVRELGKK